MGNSQNVNKLTSPYDMAIYLKDHGYDVQTGCMKATRKSNGKLAKKPGHRWRDSRRMVQSDTSLIIMTGNILIVDVDDKVDNIYDHIDIPSDCWVEKTPSGGWHIYFQYDADISAYNTNIKNKLWGFKEVDLLIKNGFAYAGGTTYALPEDGKLVTYVWDHERNPINVPKLCKIPEKLKVDILKSIREKEIKTVEDMRPYILGCPGDSITCAGCKRLSYSHMESVCQTFASMGLGRDIIREWTKDFGDDEYTSELISKYQFNNEYAYPPTLISLKRSSNHTNVLPKEFTFKNIIDTLDIYVYKPPSGIELKDHKPAMVFIELLRLESMDELIPRFIARLK
jgi:hypothetical protein